MRLNWALSRRLRHSRNHNCHCLNKSVNLWKTPHYVTQNSTWLYPDIICKWWSFYCFISVRLLKGRNTSRRIVVQTVDSGPGWQDSIKSFLDIPQNVDSDGLRHRHRMSASAKVNACWSRSGSSNISGTCNIPTFLHSTFQPSSSKPVHLGCAQLPTVRYQAAFLSPITISLVYSFVCWK